MRTLIVALILVLASTFAMCENKIGTVWFAEKENGRDWCAYSDEEIFKMDIHGGAPDNSPRGVFANEKLTELFYQTQTASGDWTVLDHYDLRAKSILLTRTIYLTADRLKECRNGEMESIIHLCQLMQVQANFNSCIFWVD